MTSISTKETLERIHAALEEARTVLNRFTPGDIEAKYKVGTDPVTEADHAVDAVLKKNLLRAGEGWLSEATVDDCPHLDKRRVWVVDPLDGTREFVQGIPEFCVSIAMVEDGVPVAGGICNPATDELILGSREAGVTYNGKPGAPHPAQRPAWRARPRKPQRSEARRVEAIRVRRVQHQADGLGRLQTRTGLCRARRPDLYLGSKKRVGCSRGRGARRKRRWLDAEARQLASALQSERSADLRPAGRRTVPARPAARPARAPLANS